MIRYNDIPPVFPGEPLTQDLMNQIIGMANNARFATGDGSIDVTQVGNTLGISLGGPRAKSDADTLVMVQGIQDKDQRAPRTTTGFLIGGLYFGALYYQPAVTFYNEETPQGITSLSPAPVPQLPVVSCYVVNLCELDGRTYPITSTNVSNITNYGTNLILQNVVAKGRFAGTTNNGLAVVVVEVPVFKPVTCSITASAGSAGQYTATILASTPRMTQPATSSVYSSVSSYGTLGTNRLASCLLINLPEVASTANSLSVGALVAGELTGQTARPGYNPIIYANSGGSGGGSANISVTETHFTGTLAHHDGTLESCGSVTLAPGLWQINGNIFIGSGGATTITYILGAVAFSNPYSVVYDEITLISAPSPVVTTGMAAPFPVRYLDNRTAGGTTPVYLIASAVSSTNQDFYGRIAALKLA